MLTPDFSLHFATLNEQLELGNNSSECHLSTGILSYLSSPSSSLTICHIMSRHAFPCRLPVYRAYVLTSQGPSMTSSGRRSRSHRRCIHRPQDHHHNPQRHHNRQPSSHESCRNRVLIAPISAFLTAEPVRWAPFPSTQTRPSQAARGTRRGREPPRGEREFSSGEQRRTSGCRSPGVVRGQTLLW